MIMAQIFKKNSGACVKFSY